MGARAPASAARQRRRVELGERIGAERGQRGQRARAAGPASPSRSGARRRSAARRRRRARTRRGCAARARSPPAGRAAAPSCPGEMTPTPSVASRPATSTRMYLPRRRTPRDRRPTATARSPRESTGARGAAPSRCTRRPRSRRPRSTRPRPRTIVSTSGSSGIDALPDASAPRRKRVGEPREVGHRQLLGAPRPGDAARRQRARDRLLAERRPRARAATSSAASRTPA